MNRLMMSRSSVSATPGDGSGARAIAASLALLAALATLLSACGGRPDAEALSRPNVLFITVDDLRPMLGAYGERYMHTPHIDRLAENGLLFRRAFVQQAWCSPSRTSVLTGLRPDSTRVYDLVTHFRDTVPDVVTLPQYFRQHGYFTGAFGKVYHRGMDDSLSWTEGTWEPDVADPLKHYVLPENIDRLDAPKQGYAAPTESAAVPDSAYPDGMITDRAIENLKRVRDRPFFLAVGFYKPHMPFNAPRTYWDLYDRTALPEPAVRDLPHGAADYAFMRWKEHHNYDGVPAIPNGTPQPDSIARRFRHGYVASVSYVDAQVGRLLAALDETGVVDETIVVVWGDHGWKLGEYNTWSKHTLYDIDTRVPLIIDRPGRPEGATDAIVELLDLYPTLTALAGLPPPAHTQGTSVRYLFDDAEAEGKEAAYSQFIRNAERTYTTYSEAVAMGQAVRTDRYRLIRWITRSAAPDTTVELYDHARDPRETMNRADDAEYADVVDRLMGRADARFKTPFP